ncbi:MAG TPA: PfkB family carbohydrate kinase, partial [Phytomonospora sp.]
YRAVPPHTVSGNPTGAGDACVAAIARAWNHRTPWPGALRDAVAASAAAVAAPQAGDLDTRTFLSLRHGVAVTEP